MKNSPKVKTKRQTPTDVSEVRGSTRSMLAELAAWRAVHVALEPADQEVFAAQHSDARCEAKGGTTRARGTLKDAMQWLRILHPAGGAKGHGDAGVDDVTSALFIDWTTRLVSAVEHGDRGAVGGGAAVVEAARAVAKARYQDERAKVEKSLGSNDAWNAALRSHLDGERHGELDADAARLYRLADAIDAWHGGSDALVKRALTTRKVTPATSAACRADADALDEARKKSVGTLGASNDPPALNVIEGRVLVLMHDVFTDVNAARAKKKTTLILTPGSATKRVLAPNSARKRKTEPTPG